MNYAQYLAIGIAVWVILAFPVALVFCRTVAVADGQRDRPQCSSKAAAEGRGKIHISHAGASK